LQERNANVPRALNELLQSRISARDDGEGGGKGKGKRKGKEDLASVIVYAAREQLSVVLRAEPMTRAQALDLLAADAFATYAFEAAADDPSSLTERADAAMEMFAALAGELNA
jgi:hypothetical protein